MRHDWNQTCSVVATVLNVNRDPQKSSPVNPMDIHPMNVGTKMKRHAVPLEDLAGYFRKH